MTIFDQLPLPPVILLAAPASAVRDHLQDWLTMVLPHCRVVAAEAPDDARRLAGALYPHAALVDIDAPAAPGLQLIHSLRRDLARTQIVALSTYYADLLSQHVREAGAAACVSPQYLGDSFVALLRSMVPPMRVAS